VFSLRAYIVEDSQVIRESLMETLQELAGLELAGFAESEPEGRQWLTSHANGWDIAIVDLFLKQGNGLGVIEACGNRNPMQKVIVLSNYATLDIRERCMRLGADAVFDKSNELDLLLEYCLASAQGTSGRGGSGLNSLN
jgi:DNA-binding NarL/FixJ family response regulator